MARDDVKAFAKLLGRVLRMQVAADPDSPLPAIVFKTVYEKRQE